MTNLFMPGEILYCIDGCSLVEVVDNQRLLPHDNAPWIIQLDPGELCLLIDINKIEALLLIGNKIFAFDRHMFSLSRHFEPFMEINDEKSCVLDDNVKNDSLRIEVHEF